MKFNTYTLSDLATIKYGKNQKKVLCESGVVPIYGTGGLMGYASDFLYDKPSVLIGRKGSIDKVRYVDHPFWTVDTLFYTIINDAIVIPKFLFYALSLIDFLQLNEGTTIPSLRTETLNRLELNIPDLPDQEKILSILNSIDDKIELNNRMNENLEQQAQTLFNSWFIDFDPYGGVCPASWKQGTLADIANITSGKRPPVKSAERTDTAVIPLVGAAAVMGYTTEANHCDKILVTGRVGTHGVVQRFNSPCWTSDNTLVITSDFYEYTYQILQRIDYHSMNRGSTQPLITQGDMNKVIILIPDQATISDFEIIAGQLMQKNEANHKENEHLATIRDTLLPMLMTGVIDLSSIDI